ncbi:bifunctional protein GlmU-like isoform X2 [Anneissia japonica]|uniref:bifunctional protein GlmU-like isoform X2 n=1 Tax=Anneissia japonica TaxID=1529436 RepID=UPI001425685B|nr:bifunctional protein GlmU-like isoform X2 [Anneissia japonica]
MFCHALRLKPGEEVISCLKTFLDRNQLQAACIVSCVGSTKFTKLRLADSKTVMEFNKPHEVVSLVGTLSRDGFHLHASISDEEAKVFGGHVMGVMEVYTTMELVIGELTHLQFTREYDDDSGYKELVIKQRET